MNVGELIKQLRIKKGLSQEDVGKHVGVQRAAVQKWESGLVQNLKRETIKKLADLFEVSPAAFFDDALEEGNAVVLGVKLVDVPLFASVSAGFGTTQEEAIGTYACIVSSMTEAKETFCVRVTGDSMMPLINDGDVIQVHRQTSVDNDDIACVLLDGSEHFVKKIKYGTDYIVLNSLNLNYKPIRLEGADVQRCYVEGKVVRVVRDV